MFVHCEFRDCTFKDTVFSDDVDYPDSNFTNCWFTKDSDALQLLAVAAANSRIPVASVPMGVQSDAPSLEEQGGLAALRERWEVRSGYCGGGINPMSVPDPEDAGRALAN